MSLRIGVAVMAALLVLYLFLVTEQKLVVLLNDGSGRFLHLENAIPEKITGSATPLSAAAADYDGVRTGRIEGDFGGGRTEFRFYEKKGLITVKVGGDGRVPAIKRRSRKKRAWLCMLQNQTGRFEIGWRLTGGCASSIACKRMSRPSVPQIMSAREV